MRSGLPFNLLVGALLAIVSGCATDPLQLENEPVPSPTVAVVRPQLGELFQLRPGEVASIENGELLIAFHSVRQDSRCPSDATCVWQGDAELPIGTAPEGGPWSWTILHTAVEPMSRVARGLLITVAGLEPVPVSGATIPQSSYRVALRVTRP